MPFLPAAEANQITHESTVLEKVRQSFAVQAQKEGLSNKEFVLGSCEALSFADGAFDAVFSRLAFHHFAEPDTPFAEMVRVLRPGGALSLSDMEAAPEPLRERKDRLETLRDPSHVRSRSADELCALYEKHGIRLLKRETLTIPVSLDAWLELTAAPAPVCARIRRELETRRQGGEATGFSPFIQNGIQNGEIFFRQRWLFLSGRKSELSPHKS